MKVFTEYASFLNLKTKIALIAESLETLAEVKLLVLNIISKKQRENKQGSVYNHTRVSLPSSHTHVVVSETRGFGYSHTRIQSYTVTHS